MGGADGGLIMEDTACMGWEETVTPAANRSDSVPGNRSLSNPASAKERMKLQTTLQTLVNKWTEYLHTYICM